MLALEQGMAWNYVSLNDSESRARRQFILDQTARWWSAFATKRPALEASLLAAARALNGGAFDGMAERVLAVPADLTGWMGEQIGSIDPRLHWEFGQEASGQLFLAISAGDCLRLAPMVRSVVAAAPHVAGWVFLGQRPPIQAHWAMQAARQRTGLSAIAPSVLSRLGSNNRIDMTFKMKLARDDEASAIVLSAGLAEAILGEHLFTRWVGDIDVEPLDRGPAAESYLGLSQLRTTVTGLVQTLTNSLPEQPLYKQESPRKWPTFRYTPAPSNDYPRQDDLAIGRSIVPAVRAAAFGEGPGRGPGSPFYSTSFSRSGETFCYLKIDMPGVSVEQRRKRKYEIEEPVDHELRRGGAGCVIGSSTGLRYIYLDLAVMDVKQALAVLAPVLRPMRLPERTWLLFYDTEMADEYVGLLSGSGAPPPVPAGAADFSRRPAIRPAPAPQVEAPSLTDLLPNELLF
jgi:hypothetical protein